LLFVSVAIALSARFDPLGILGPGNPDADVTESAPTVPSSAATQATVPPADSLRSLRSDEQAFAEAYLGLAESYNRQASDLLIANPLSEFDLVGARLTDLVDLTRAQLTDLPALTFTAGQVGELEREMAAVGDLLRGIDPHGPELERTTAYRLALDYWTEHVQPASDAIRAAVGLAPSASGDLRL
jgi:hypothetical protein